MKKISFAFAACLLIASASAAEKKSAQIDKADAAEISLAPVEKKPEMIDASDLLTNTKVNPDFSDISVKASTGCKTKLGSVLAEGDAGYRQCLLDREATPANQRTGEEGSATFQFGK